MAKINDITSDIERNVEQHDIDHLQQVSAMFGATRTILSSLCELNKLGKRIKEVDLSELQRAATAISNIAYKNGIKS